VSDEAFKTTIYVREVMSNPVVAVDEDATAAEVAKVLRDNGVSSAFVQSKSGEYIGIVTKGDLVYKVMAEGVDPEKVRAKDIMSRPIKYVSADDTIQKALKIFRAHRVGRLGVVYKGRVVGVLSLQDIVRVLPEILDILSEKAMIKMGVSEAPRQRTPIIGYCDHCGNWSDELRLIDGKFYCPDCVVDLFGGQR